MPQSLTDSTPTAGEGAVELAETAKDEESTPVDNHLSEIPDGGLRAWLSVLGGYVAFFIFV